MINISLYGGSLVAKILQEDYVPGITDTQVASTTNNTETTINQTADTTSSNNQYLSLLNSIWGTSQNQTYSELNITSTLQYVNNGLLNLGLGSIGSEYFNAENTDKSNSYSDEQFNNIMLVGYELMNKLDNNSFFG